MLRYPRIAIATTALIGIIFSLSVDKGSLDVRSPMVQPSDIEPLRFEISFHRGVLKLDGHTASSSHERELLHQAGLLFSGVKLNTAFELLAGAPDQWSATTLALLEAISATRSASARLTATSLRIRGVASDAWPEQLRNLGNSLPPSIELDVDFVVPDPRVRIADLCARAFATHHQNTVYFEESGTTFRNSAYGVLDRIISLADACRDSTISITGHSDSSGYEPSNQKLSLARARSVADYVAGRGISRERIIVDAAGSSQPIADNATRHGRSLNRRITIDLRQRESADAR